MVPKTNSTGASRKDQMPGHRSAYKSNGAAGKMVTISILLFFAVLGCVQRNESGQQTPDSKPLHTDVSMNVLKVEETTNIITVTSRVQQLSSAEAIDIARREAENNEFSIDDIEFSHLTPTNDVWWIGLRGRKGATEGIATVIISEEGIGYKPPRHILEEVEAVQIAKLHAKRRGGSEFELL